MSPSPARAGVVALRVVRQLKRDRRTIGLIVFAPIVLMILFGYALSGDMSGVALGLVDGGGHAGPAGAHRIDKGLRSPSSGLTVGCREAHKRRAAGWSCGAGAGRGAGPAGRQQPADRCRHPGSGAGRVRPAERPGGDGRLAVGAESSIATRYIFGYDLEMMDTVGPAILGLVVFFFTFINAAIAFIRERSQGTLEKFMVSPLSRVEMISGYVLGFSLFTLLQSATTLSVVTFGFGVPMTGSPLTALFVVLILGAGALVLGSFFSSFARSEFQVVQFIPLIITPQIVLCGIWWPLQSVPEFIRPISYILPLTYAADALRAVMLNGAGIVDILYPDLLALGVFFLVFFAAATLMLRREVA